jgi:anaerobic magnesium-protoporphyrin IX monomethyl ester cyclase
MSDLVGANQLDREILDFINTTPYGSASNSDAAFDRLVKGLFEFQFEKNKPYRRFCENRGCTPATLAGWESIPAVSTQTFKQLPLTVFPHTEAVRKLQTSGTTGASMPGTVYLDPVGLAIYDASHMKTGDAMIFAGSPHRFRALFLLPSPKDRPNMGIVYGMPKSVESQVVGEAHFLVGPKGLDLPRLLELLRDAEKTGQQVIVMGASFGFVHLFDHCADEGLKFQLPAGSLYLDGGGFKGASREITKDQLCALVTEYLGIPRDHMVNGLGLTEVAATFWDNVRYNLQRKRTTPLYKIAPPWARVICVEPENLKRVPKGEQGLLRYVTIANRSTVLAVQTDDVGYETDDGFEIIGRAKGAAPRGCSISVDEMIGSAKSLAGQ